MDTSEITEQREISIESVIYASEIQKGLLPKSRHFQKMGIDYNVWWEPHSILAGDFYWLGKKDKYFYIAVADCTGHGISASLLTVMGISLLNYIILGKDLQHPGEYLKELDKKWIETFLSDKESDFFNNDWMEIILMKINIDEYSVEFSGAMLYPIIVKQNGDLINVNTNNYPIGGWQIEKNRYYHSEKYILEKGDEIYLFTDGIIDQFGGEKNKKFGIKNFRKLLKEIRTNNLSEKVDEIQRVINLWRGDKEQTDDITLLGLRF